MPIYTIETTYHLPVYRQRTYNADTIADACRKAIEDDGWADAKEDVDTSGETYVSGIWQGADAAYSGPAILIPSQFAETVERKAGHFEILLGLSSSCSRTCRPPDRPHRNGSLAPPGPSPVARRSWLARAILTLPSRETGHDAVHRQDRLLAARL